MEAVYVVLDTDVERGCDRSLLLIASYMHKSVVVSSVGELMHEA